MKTRDSIDIIDSIFFFHNRLLTRIPQQTPLAKCTHLQAMHSSQAMLQNVNALEFASERLRGLKSLILEAISFNTAALQHATPELRCLEI